jgi:hypothetical protein
VFATSLMNGLGLSRGALKDGFPMLHRIFQEASVGSAMIHGFEIDARNWPLKDGHPAIASKRAQVLTYSLAYFMVRDLVEHQRRRTFLSVVAFGLHLRPRMVTLPSAVPFEHI